MEKKTQRELERALLLTLRGPANRKVQSYHSAHRRACAPSSSNCERKAPSLAEHQLNYGGSATPDERRHCLQGRQGVHEVVHIETKEPLPCHRRQFHSPRDCGGRCASSQARPNLIPWQLQRPEFRFVLIPRGSKAPWDKDWPTINNYPFDDPKLMAWLMHGGNYGVCCGFGNLVGIDADDPIVAELFERHFGPTFRVGSGSGRGFP
jgi:hypothetical protein